jgi:hypothetical protein
MIPQHILYVNEHLLCSQFLYHFPLQWIGLPILQLKKAHQCCHLIWGKILFMMEPPNLANARPWSPIVIWTFLLSIYEKKIQASRSLSQSHKVSLRVSKSHHSSGLRYHNVPSVVRFGTRPKMPESLDHWQTEVCPTNYSCKNGNGAPIDQN